MTGLIHSPFDVFLCVVIVVVRKNDDHNQSWLQRKGVKTINVYLLEHPMRLLVKKKKDTLCVCFVFTHSFCAVFFLCCCLLSLLAISGIAINNLSLQSIHTVLIDST